MSESPAGYWRKCTTCKKPIHFGQKYWICSVSTCNRIRTDLVFCDLRCFDAHVPVMNHRDAGAFEKKAPSQAQAQTSGKAQGQTQTQVPSQVAAHSSTPTPSRPNLDDEILVVVSKVKKYIRDRAGFNTSDSVMDFLSGEVRKMADRSVVVAKQNGRKTVLDRDLS